MPSFFSSPLLIVATRDSSVEPLALSFPSFDVVSISGRRFTALHPRTPSCRVSASVLEILRIHWTRIEFQAGPTMARGTVEYGPSSTLPSSPSLVVEKLRVISNEGRGTSDVGRNAGNAYPYFSSNQFSSLLSFIKRHKRRNVSTRTVHRPLFVERG